jgi:hypothetical protein
MFCLSQEVAGRWEEMPCLHLSQVPSFPEVVNLLGAGLGEADRDEQILFDVSF